MDFEEKKLLKKLNRARDANKLDDWELLCRRLAEYCASVGRYEDALHAYQEELSVSERRKDASGIATANRMVGEMYSMLGQYAESLKHVNLYLDFARETKNCVEEQRALATIGRTYFCWAADLKTSNKIKAEEVLKQCRKAFMKSLYICEEKLKHIDNKERQEMMARIFFNLGLVCEIEEDIPKALDYVTKSITICKCESLWEDLHRCLMSKATLLFKQSETSAALSYIDQACEAAKKLPNTIELTVLAFIQKGEIFFNMGNFVGAKNALKKAYKLKTPNEADQKTVEILLKKAMLLVELEFKLKGIDDKPLEERKDIYEKFGDACCGVKHFKRAIQAYLNMLECAIALGQRDKELLPCYVSLYRTYIDNKDYDNALNYALKELEISKKFEKEAAKSHLAIADIKELKKISYYEIMEHYNKALELCGDDEQTKITALKRLAALQKNDGREREAKETEKRLIGLDYESDDSIETELDELSDIHLSDLSDSDEETKRRSARNSFRLTRNEKGETPLQVAAIKGDLARAQRLIHLGHPVKERDAAGWTPLHEAANYGHLEICKLLIKAGANVNDAGGKECNGVTPLHDAASCGHFDVIRLLLENNASVSVLTDDSETPLDYLKAWRRRIGHLNENDEDAYNDVLKLLQDGLNAVGFQSEPKKQEKKRRWALISPPPSDSSLSNSPPPKCKTIRDYRATIEALRKRPIIENCQKPVVKSALLDENSYVEEWLDNDMKHVQKKKRKNSDLIEYVLDDSDDEQSNLIDAGFTAEPVIEDSNKFMDYPSSPPLSSSSAPHLTKVRVTVEKILLLIYIESSKQKELNVKWLTEEAAKRYYEIEGRQPILQLQTIDGAIFSPLDPVCVVLGEDINGIVKGWKTSSLTSRYKDSISLIPVPVPDSAYGAFIQGPDQSIIQCLAVCDATGRLELDNMALTVEELQPVFRILKQETAILALSLRGNVLGDSGLESLAENLKQCPIKHLNLSCNNITRDGLEKFLDSFETLGSDLLSTLQSLDVSFNPIGDTTFPQLTKFPNLSEFKADYCEDEFY